MRALTFAEISSCARGCVSCQESPEGVRFPRFPLSAFNHYAAPGPRQEFYTIRTNCSAGVRLAFHSDAENIGLAVKLSHAARAASFVDIWVDGIFAGSLGSVECIARIDGVFNRLAGGRRERLFEIYLPHVRAAALESLRLDDKSSFRPAQPRPVMLALGDSITQGMNSFHPSLGYAMTAARLLGLDLHDYGVGGAHFDAANLPEAPVANPKLIIVAYGCNDYTLKVSPNEAGAYLRQVRKLFPSTRLVVLEPIWFKGEDLSAERDPGWPEAPLSDYRSRLRHEASAIKEALLIPSETLFPGGLQFAPDGCHPDEKGHLLYGNNLAVELKRLCPEL